jgi:hypothetical protein
MITGTSNSRLTELKKYAVTDIFENQYIGNGSLTFNGVDYNLSDVNNHIIYYIDTIKFVDIINNTGIYSGYTSGTTLNIFEPQGFIDLNFINQPIYKDPNKNEIISLHRIDNDVFIDRQSISVFDDNYQLNYISNIGDLITFVGGNYYNIINNS